MSVDEDEVRRVMSARDLDYRALIIDQPTAKARLALFDALYPRGCSETTAVLEAIEALIDAKRAEGLDAPDAWMDLAVVPRTARQLTDPYAELGPGDRSRHEVNSCEGYRGLCPTCAARRPLHAGGNEDAQTPGIDEGSDSEAVTADPPPGYGRSRVLGIRSRPVTISPMDRRAAELGDPHAQTLVAFASSSVTDWEALAGHAAAQRDFLLANLPRHHDVVQAAGQWALDRWDELRASR